MLGFFKKRALEREEVEIQEEYEDCTALAEYFYGETGITFEKQKSILKSKLISFAKQHKIYSFETLLTEVKSTPALRQELINYLTTNETFFYREFRQIEELVATLKESQKEATILCAPCATGEEPYSIAIALLEARVAPSYFKIVAIDINSEAITNAKIASYTQRNLRNLSPQIIQKYFTQEGKRFILNADIKSLVDFKIANIFESEFLALGKFDFVFSRNMLIYFDRETKLKAKSILESMRRDTKQKLFFGHADLF